MPSYWTHFAFANDCRKRLFARVAPSQRGALTRAIAAHPHAFCAGMQGPDPFLFYLPAAFRKRRLSSVMHTEQTARLLCRLLTHAHSMQGRDRSIALSYVAGFLGHYLLDSHTHPFVYARAGIEHSRDSFCIHNALEADLNALAVRRSFGKPLREMSRPCAYELTAAQRKVLRTLYSDLLERVYHIDCSPAKVERALWSVQKCYRVLYDPQGRKALVVRSAEKLAGHAYLSPLFLGESHYFKDPANLQRCVWVDPFTKKASRADFFELYDRALEQYVPLIAMLESSDATSPRVRRAILNRLCKRDFHGEPISMKQ